MRCQGRKNQTGFTLVELLIALAITAIVLSKAVSFGIGWVQSATIADTQSSLTEAIARAKSIALMNDISVVDGSHVASVCVADNNLVTLHKKTIVDAVGCRGEIVWQQLLSSDVVIRDGIERMSCMCFDNRAHRTLKNCSNCSVTNTVSINVGNDYEVTGIL
jgi:prepilin-type N-terminal cleavage/methylation domain-containing protein